MFTEIDRLLNKYGFTLDFNGGCYQIIDNKNIIFTACRRDDILAFLQGVDWRS